MVKRTISLLTAVVVMVVMMYLASPAWAQGFSGPNYGPNGPYYGPYDYCGWSVYACLYPPSAPASSTASPPSAPPAAAVARQLPATGGLDAIPLLGLGGGALLVAGGLLARSMIQMYRKRTSLLEVAVAWFILRGVQPISHGSRGPRPCWRTKKRKEAHERQRQPVSRRALQGARGCTRSVYRSTPRLARLFRRP